MARKAVLEGGKRDEIIRAAMQLFFENGFEATSVRMILNSVGGEVGMFYHYFKSKEELFGQVVEYFFRDYRKHFEEFIENCDSAEMFVEQFLDYYEVSMVKYTSLSKNMHWTIQYAMAARTIKELVPAIEKLLVKCGYEGSKPLEIAASQYLYAISGTIHTDTFCNLSVEEKKQQLNQLEKLFLI